jgi:hypothetical protein
VVVVRGALAPSLETTEARRSTGGRPDQQRDAGPGGDGDQGRKVKR